SVPIRPRRPFQSPPVPAPIHLDSRRCRDQEGGGDFRKNPQSRCPPLARDRDRRGGQSADPTIVGLPSAEGVRTGPCRAAEMRGVSPRLRGANLSPLWTWAESSDPPPFQRPEALAWAGLARRAAATSSSWTSGASFPQLERS